MNKIKRIAVFNDISCFGKCSLTVALPVISSFGVEAVPLPTALLSTHTGGFSGYTKTVLTDELRGIIGHFEQLKLHFDCIYTGYFCSEQQIRLAAEFIKKFKAEDTVVLVDPVMGDGGSLYDGFNADTVAALRDLCALADYITPNYTEAAFLADMPQGTAPDLLLKGLCGKNKIITGVPDGERIGYFAQIDGQTVTRFSSRQQGVLHGCGDVFAAALAAKLVEKDGKTAFSVAADFCDKCIFETEKLTEHCYGTAFEKVLRGAMSSDKI